MKLYGGARNISGDTSIFLDSLRILAALTVFIVHCYDLWHYPLGGHEHTNLDNIAHSSVIIFFVLSGYVIAHTTTSNNRGRMQYAQARISRLISIVIPALVITAIVQIIIRYADISLYVIYTRGSSWPKYLSAALFMNEIWFHSSAPPGNGPLWSLSFEFWYYAIFGLWFFRSKGWVSYLLLFLACVIVGPKILLMMPIWIGGNLAYRLKRPDISAGASWIMVLTMLIIAGLMVIYLPLWPYTVGTPPFYFGAQFITDWIIGLFISAALWILPTANTKPNGGSAEVKQWRNVFRKFADLTFPIYVLHDPLLFLWRAFSHPVGYNDNKNMFIGMFIVFVSCILIGLFLENRRHWWTMWTKKITYRLKDIYDGLVK